MTARMRIARFLAGAGLGSRRRCEQLVLEGRVRVNGAPISSLADRVDPHADRVEIDGRRVGLSGESLTVMVHKPRGYLTTCRDPQGRAIVLDLLPDSIRNRGLFPVGRLDKDTEGILLLTSDGDLAYRLAHPRFGVDKTYSVRVRGQLSDESAQALEAGIPLGDALTAPAKVLRLKRARDRTELDIVIHEGRKRQVRRMLLAVGHRVERLVRTRFGPLVLGELPPGGWRFLDREELSELKSACGLAETDPGGEANAPGKSG